MGNKIFHSTIKSILVIFMTVVWSLPAYSDLVEINRELTIERMENGFVIQRNLDMQRRQTNEILRGNDLATAVKDLIRRAKDSLSHLKWRRSDQQRGAELTQITNSNAKDIIRRNKIIQQTQKSTQQDRMRDLRAKNRDLNQRTRDLSRK